MTTNTKDACWICGRAGGKAERTLLGFKKPICPTGVGCSRPQPSR